MHQLESDLTKVLVFSFGLVGITMSVSFFFLPGECFHLLADKIETLIQLE